MSIHVFVCVDTFVLEVSVAACVNVIVFLALFSVVLVFISPPALLSFFFVCSISPPASLPKVKGQNG